MRFKIQKFFLNILFSFILDKEKRRMLRKLYMEKIIQKQWDSTKWGVSYSVFDGEELLESSIKQIRNCVDYINIVYQKNSWYGNPAKSSLLETLQKLKNDNLVDELIEFKPDFKVNAGTQERKKRNLGLKYAKKAGVNYFMTMDCDEFYIEKEFVDAQKFIIKNGITHSFCDIYNYYSPTLRRLDPTRSYVEFFSKINTNSKLVKENKKCITLVDPTRMLSDCYGSKYWFLHRIAMHHMTYFRKDIVQKITNSTAKEAYKEIPKPNNCCNVPDIFNLENLFGKE